MPIAKPHNSTFVLYDNETGRFVRDIVTCNVTFDRAKKYVRKHAAITEAALMNVSRNVPPGRTPDHKYSYRPQVEVREYDAAGNVVSTVTPPPSWFTIP
jgi:hypothetical protein